MEPKNFPKKLSKKMVCRTPDQFRRLNLRRGPTVSTRVRSFGGHQ